MDCFKIEKVSIACFKTCLSLLFFYFFLPVSFSFCAFELSNKYLKVLLDDETGRFSAHLNKINVPDLEAFDALLLEDADWPPTSCSAVIIGNREYFLGSEYGKRIRCDVFEDTLLYSWELKKIIVEQEISIKDKFKIRIDYRIKNDSRLTEKIGFKALLDILVREKNLGAFSKEYGRIENNSINNFKDIYFLADGISCPNTFYVKTDASESVLGDYSLIVGKKNRISTRENEDKCLQFSWKNSKLKPSEILNYSIEIGFEKFEIGRRALTLDLLQTNFFNLQSVEFMVKNNSFVTIDNISIDAQSDDFGISSMFEDGFKLNFFESKLFSMALSPLNNNPNKNLKFIVEGKAGKDPVKCEFSKTIGLQPELKLEKCENTNIPLFMIKAKNIFTPAKWNFTLYNSDMKSVKVIIGTNSLPEKIDVGYKGLLEGTFYFCDFAVFDGSGKGFSSEKAMFFTELAPVETDKNIIFSFPSVNFNYNSAALKRYSYPVLDMIAEKLKKINSKTKIRIEGYTDDIGMSEPNIRLSEQRAMAVMEYFVGVKGLKDDIFLIKGFGESNPKESNQTEEGREKNRRVEIIVDK